MSPLRRTLVGLSHRFAYAALISALVWVGFRLPIPEGTYPPTTLGVRNTIVRWLDLPIAATTQLLPCEKSAIDLWFRIRCPFNAGLETFFWNHMGVGIATYMLLFYLPTFYRLARRRWVRQGGKTAERP